MSEEDTQAARDDPFTRNKKNYAEIAKQMTATGYPRTMSQVKYKLQSLKQRYKKVLDSNRRNGRGRTSWEYFAKTTGRWRNGFVTFADSYRQLPLRVNARHFLVKSIFMRIIGDKWAF